MKQLTLAIALALLVTPWPVYPAPGEKTEKKGEVRATIDKPAPDFELTDLEGNKHKLSDYRGKYVVLEWTNPDCPFVKKHYKGNMQAMQSKYGEKGVVWLTICSSAPGKQGHYKPSDARKIARERKLAAAAYLNDERGNVGRMYGAKTTPHMYVIDPKGTLIYAGAIDSKPSTKVVDIASATNYVQSCLDAAMAGKKIDPKATTPYGCSVKYSKAD